jgi:hypothetical protein
VIDNNKGVLSNEMSVGGDHNVEQALTQNPRKSVKLLSQQLNLKASTYRISGKDEMQQALHGANKAWRVDFYGDLKMSLEDNPAVL